MATIRIPASIYEEIHQHLFSTEGEHFACLRSRWALSCGEPVLQVHHALLARDESWGSCFQGYRIHPQSMADAVNATRRSDDDALIELHNHGGSRPRFSSVDRKGLRSTVAYIFASLPGRPYAATIWTENSIYGEYFLPDGRRSGIVDSIVVDGDRLRQVVSRDDDGEPTASIFARQLPWFAEEGQRQLRRLKIGLVGVGGTGSHVAQQLAYLGCRSFVLVDHDTVEDTNLNRLVTATPADLSTPKGIACRRLIRSIAPDAQVVVVPEKLQTLAALDILKGVDVLFGCVDNDGARHILNALALAYRVPYFDLGVGITAPNGRVSTAGGRVAAVLPGGPCLYCMRAINVEEARFFLMRPEEQALQIEHGYVRGMNIAAPAVVSLNGTIASIAINEFCIYVSGLRPVHPHTMLDLLGHGRATRSQWLTPTRVAADPKCLQCATAGRGDSAGIELYAAPLVRE